MSPTDATPVAVDLPALLLGDVAVAGAVADEAEAEQVLRMRFILHWAWRAQRAAHEVDPWGGP